MTTSNDTIYQLGRDEIIKAALRKLGVIAQGQSPSTEDITNASIALNMLVAEFRTIGMPLWARKEYTFNPVAGQQVYQFGIGKTFNIPFPLHLLQAFRQDGTSTTKIRMEIIPNYNLNLYPTSSGGTPIQVSYQPFNNYGELSVWPVPDSTATGSTVNIIYQSPFQYFDAATDTMDFPEEWYNALVFGLAATLAPEWTIPLEDRQRLSAEAKQHLDNAKDFGYEDGSIYFQPQRRRM
jgi:hypothetical protein